MGKISRSENNSRDYFSLQNQLWFIFSPQLSREAFSFPGTWFPSATFFLCLIIHKLTYCKNKVSSNPHLIGHLRLCNQLLDEFPVQTKTKYEMCSWFGGFQNGFSRQFKFVTGYFGISVFTFVYIKCMPIIVIIRHCGSGCFLLSFGLG